MYMHIKQCFRYQFHTPEIISLDVSLRTETLSKTVTCHFRALLEVKLLLNRYVVCSSLPSLKLSVSVILLFMSF